MYATHLVVTPQGVSGAYRKFISRRRNDAVFPRRPGFTPFSARTYLRHPALLRCHFPELSTCMALKGCDLIVMPHASPRGTPKEKLASWMRHLTARAFDNGVFIAACNQVGDNRHGLNFPGVAMVFGPDGRVVRQYVANKEGLLLVDLKAALLKSVRQHRMRYFLPHRRPEIYQL